MTGGVTNLGLCQMSSRIWCILHGEVNSLSVPFVGTQTVDQLKEAIKTAKRPRLDHIAANELNLYKINIAELDGKRRDERIEEELKKDDFHPLHETEELSETYGQGLPHGNGMVHILVMPPRGESQRYTRGYPVPC
jgi:hypothetical protein